MNNLFKQTVKKLTKTGYFHGFTFSGSAMSWKHSNRTFSLQYIPGKIGYRFASGYVSEWTERKLTFESDYKTLGPVKCAHFSADFIQQTNNPDYVRRACIQLIGVIN